MSRFGLFLVLTAVFCLFNCSDNPVDDSPPYIVNDQIGFYTSFDTVEVTFNESLREFTTLNYTTTAPLNCSLKVASQKIVQCYSNENHYSETPQLPTDSLISIQFINIFDNSANVTNAIEYAFKTGSFIDFDTPESGNINGQQDDAISLNDSNLTHTTENYFYNGINIDSGITLSGYIENTPFGLIDIFDIYTINLRAYDTIHFELNDVSQNVDFMIRSEELDTNFVKREIPANSSLSYDFVIDPVFFLQLTQNYSHEREPFYLFLQHMGSSETATPYTLTIQRTGRVSNQNWPE